MIDARRLHRSAALATMLCAGAAAAPFSDPLESGGTGPAMVRIE